YNRTLNDVCQRLDSIEHTIRENRSSFACVWVLVVGWLVVAGFSDFWHSKLRYSLWYNISSDQITIEKRPTDCDFFRAPLGDKGCRYERQVRAVRVKTKYIDLWSGSVNYVSFDDGKTWTVDDSTPPRKPGVMISWERVEEQ